MIVRGTLDKKYTARYIFPLYYLSSDRLRELKKKGANFKFVALKVVTVAYEKCLIQIYKCKLITFWKTGRLQEVDARLHNTKKAV